MTLFLVTTAIYSSIILCLCGKENRKFISLFFDQTNAWTAQWNHTQRPRVL